MKRLFITSFIVLVLIATGVVAQSVDVTISPSSLVATSGETQSVDITIKNKQSVADTFSLSLFPSQFEKVSPSMESFLVTIEPNSEKTIKLYFTVAIDSDIISPVFSVTAKSTTDSSISNTENVILTIQRKSPVYIRDVALEKYAFNPSENVEFKVKLVNLEETTSAKYFLKINVLKGRDTVKSFHESIDSIGAKSEFSVEKSFQLDNYASPGPYVIETQLVDLSNNLKYAKSINFNVNTVTQPPTEYVERSTVYSVAVTTTTIKTKNEGNVALPAFTVTESVPKFAQSLFSPLIEPGKTEDSNGRMVYSWQVQSLAPGEQYTVTYNFAIWRIWLVIGIISGVTYGLYKWLATPKVVKGVRHSGELKRGKEVIVLVEVKNRSFHEIKDVEVVDVVPKILKVLDKFDTLRPKGRKLPGGIELRWAIDSMRPREERVLTYKVVPVVDIEGFLNLPQAQMTYVDRHKIRRGIVSKEVLAKV
ncbi:MAG: hypothetical protein HYW24_02525 [Candidatus Aenigmarchaeota archaeon]|nr:hypothetical protein [Candidatus Aenigmarchaeota archaeon]